MVNDIRFGGWPTPLKNDGVRQIGSSSQLLGKIKSHFPNHQQGTDRRSCDSSVIFRSQSTHGSSMLFHHSLPISNIMDPYTMCSSWPAIKVTLDRRKIHQHTHQKKQIYQGAEFFWDFFSCFGNFIFFWSWARFPHFFLVFHDFSLVFHWFSFIFPHFFLVFQYFSLVFHNFPQFFIVFHYFSLVFHHVPHFFLVFHYFFLVFHWCSFFIGFPSLSLTFPRFPVLFLWFFIIFLTFSFLPQ